MPRRLDANPLTEMVMRVKENKVMIRSALIAAMVLSSAGAASAAPDAPIDTTVTAKPTEIVETRIEKLIKDDRMFSSEHSGVAVKLRIAGAAVNNAAAYGKLKLTEAIDDTGADLRPKPAAKMVAFGGAGDGDRFTEIHRFGMREDDKSRESFDMSIDLVLPARKATRIVSLKGTFEVQAGGQEKLVTVANPKSLTGKSIDDPVLKSAGLTVQIESPKGAGGTNSLPLKVKGNSAAIKKVEIVDAAGKSISDQSMSMGTGDERTTTYTLNKPLDDTITLKIHVLAGLKNVNVPFDLKNLALP